MDKVQAVMNDFGMERSEIHHKLMIAQANRVNSNDITASDVTALLTRIARGKCVSLYASEQMVRIIETTAAIEWLDRKLSSKGVFNRWCYSGLGICRENRQCRRDNA